MEVGAAETAAPTHASDGPHLVDAGHLDPAAKRRQHARAAGRATAQGPDIGERKASGQLAPLAAPCPSVSCRGQGREMGIARGREAFDASRPSIEGIRTGDTGASSTRESPTNVRGPLAQRRCAAGRRSNWRLQAHSRCARSRRSSVSTPGRRGGNTPRGALFSPVFPFLFPPGARRDTRFGTGRGGSDGPGSGPGRGGIL